MEIGKKKEEKWERASERMSNQSGKRNNRVTKSEKKER